MLQNGIFATKFATNIVQISNSNDLKTTIIHMASIIIDLKCTIVDQNSDRNDPELNRNDMELNRKDCKSTRSRSEVDKNHRKS